MASFARSFKPPASYLAPVRRPGMPGRTISNSSELSLTSNASGAPPDDNGSNNNNSGERSVSAPGTPYISGPEDDQRASTKNSPDGFPFHSPRSASHSRPIAIELPKLKKLASPSSACTPPEPLSARGDLPGGYFPNHEDPQNRVHRPHPFTHEPRSPFILSDSVAMQADRRLRTSHPAMSSSMASANLPVSSYLAPGFHDAPVPMGKYYPSNYERTARETMPQRQTRPADGAPSSVKSDSQVPQYTSGETPEAETRRKMQQYQRDMIAQAAMALGGSSKATKAGATVALNGVPLRDAAWYTSSPHKPASPRLDPLGSPGPVTPMDLDAGRGGYLDRGKDRLSRDNMPPPATHVGPRSM
ncbi:2,6-dihydropseudooxynicotine hydrolase [Purpureocillium lavendulum]|uniref:2,6-dihydropseudooxynicotine hydrolase n=1 Tax=Purpureocillium lavendulum TaxID=1247861 RepID=A0AB34FVC9_9HYPO|nr:2,6-dihydropseudooxynicotine hydrolase [Purpureocillium lavendulum]